MKKYWAEQPKSSTSCYQALNEGCAKTPRTEPNLAQVQLTKAKSHCQVCTSISRPNLAVILSTGHSLSRPRPPDMVHRHGEGHTINTTNSVKNEKKELDTEVLTPYKCLL